MKPIIGLTTYGYLEQQFSTIYYEHHYALPRDYIDSVKRAGGVPLLIPPNGDEVDELWHIMDGLIVTGGTDVSPVHYHGEVNNGKIFKPDPDRDATEIALVRRAVKQKDIPILCICRGMQILNVAQGGTLYPHLPDVREADIHRNEDGGWTQHECIVKQGSLLARVMGTDRVTTFSGHHQAVDKIANGLEVVAEAPDDTVEALIAPDHPWLIGVQWHPEKTTVNDPSQHRLFAELVRVAGQKKK